MEYSIALCTYNGEDFLEEQLLSIEKQFPLPAEVILFDDCSTDNTINIINKFINNGNLKIRLTQNDCNIGFFKNFQKAIEACTSEIIFLCDQDDIWHPNKSNEFIKKFEKQPNTNVLFSNGRIISVDKQLNGQFLFANKNFTLQDQDYFNSSHGPITLLLNKSFVTGATMAFRKSYRNNFEPFTESDFFIHDSWIATIAACDNCIDYIDEPLIQYRVHNKNAIGAIISNEIKISFSEVLNANMSKAFKRELVVTNFLIERGSCDNIGILKKRQAFILKHVNQKNKLRTMISPKLFTLKFYHYHSFYLYLKNSIKVILGIN